MDRFDPFVKYADVYGDIINWEKDPMNKPQNQNKYFFSDGKTYYEQICKMLRLMSVFKEAFNQIYSNEDEISEAWENFVNNLSASVVEGSEPDVTLTWTDDSVNFEFTMVPGVPGEQGVGITSISFNSDYTMTITLSDGNTYTSMSLKGETGPQGPQGETGSGLQILDVYATLADLQSAHPTGQPGDAYQVGSEGSYTLYIWSSSQSAWIPAGSLGTVSPSISNPLMDGTASAGSSDLYSRGDHVHPTDTSRASKEELDALIRTSQSLIDQSFTYRESPAIQDGLARFDKIKGNTLVWNQLVQNGNFADLSNWYTRDGATLTVSDNVGTLVTTSASISAIINRFSYVQGHKYLIKLSAKSSSGQILGVGLSNNGGTLGNPKMNISATSTWQEYSVVGIATATPSAGDNGLVIRNNNASAQTVELKNVQVFDLTQMGLDTLTDAEVKKWFAENFPLPYYEYDAGSLLSFNGNGLKTTGKNLFNSADVITGKYVNDTNGDFRDQSNSVATNYIEIIPNTEYKIISAQRNGMWGAWYDANKTFISGFMSYTTAKTSPPNAKYVAFTISYDGNNQDYANNVMLLFNGEDETFEPYTSTTTDLPISTYFQTGMKSAGSAYDELTESKAITRIGTVDLGSLTWEYRTTGSTFTPYFYTAFTGIKPNGDPNSRKANILCSKYSTAPRSQGVFIDKTICADGSSTELTQLQIKDSSYTDTTAFKNSLQGQYLYYELATPTETAVDLDLSFNAYENGTEQLLPVNGSVPSTSPIIADMTYLSIDDAMEYIIDKLANVPQNTQQILESLEDDVADLRTDVGTLQTDVSGLQTSVGNINTNIGQISSTVAGHTSSISDMQSDITDLNTDLGDLSDTVTDHTSRIGTLETGLSTTNGNVQNLETSVSDLDDTVTAQGTTVTALDSIIQDISNNPVVGSLGSHELGFVAAYVSATLAANTGTKVTIPKPVIFPNNYTPLFIVGMSTGSYNVSICEIPYTFGNRDSVDCRVWNHGGQQTTQITVYILCMRQRQSQ